MYWSYAYSSLAFKYFAYSHSRIFDNPPVVHILEGIAGHLLLMGTAPAILIPLQKFKKNMCVTVHFCAEQSLQHKPAPDHWLHSYTAQRICASALFSEGLRKPFAGPKLRYLHCQMKNHTFTLTIQNQPHFSPDGVSIRVRMEPTLHGLAQYIPESDLRAISHL